ncbi:MAG: methylenetetrahydrofolate reductase [Woeseia sp.]
MTVRDPIGITGSTGGFGPLPITGPPVADFVAGFSIEATPKQLERVGALETRLPAGTSVFVPFLPRAIMSDTARACLRLSNAGLRPVPHLTARAMPSRTRLAESLSQLAEAGADSLLLIAGDRRRAAGPYKSTLGIFDSGLLQHYGFRHIAVAGHPEGHRAAGDDVLFAALREKSAYARETGSTMWVVTQFAFAADPVLTWLRRLGDEGVYLPVRIGMPGPAKVQTLIRYAVQCGVGASSHMLARRPGAVSRLLGRWSPDEMLHTLAPHSGASSELPIEGVHVFPFGGLLESIDFFTRQ